MSCRVWRAKKLETIEELTAEGQKLLESGIERVVISLGGRGALYLRKGSTIYAEGRQGSGRQVRSVRVTAWWPRWTYAESQDMSEENAVRLSTATGAANVMCSGTQPPSARLSRRCFRSTLFQAVIVEIYRVLRYGEGEFYYENKSYTSACCE